MCRPPCPFHPPVVRKYLPGQTQPDGFPLTPCYPDESEWRGEMESERKEKKKEGREKRGKKRKEERDEKKGG